MLRCWRRILGGAEGGAGGQDGLGGGRGTLGTAFLVSGGDSKALGVAAWLFAGSSRVQEPAPSSGSGLWSGSCWFCLWGWVTIPAWPDPSLGVLWGFQWEKSLSLSLWRADLGPW